MRNEKKPIQMNYPPQAFNFNLIHCLVRAADSVSQTKSWTPQGGNQTVRRRRIDEADDDHARHHRWKRLI
jgi:hypothetical protein